ncbi:MAG TPA: substrate-binding domain-containing protein [Alphaproteobacteria bacterium]|nr:substrate-binding domain-containing protein [Alphaproteobacteria bacterium]
MTTPSVKILSTHALMEPLKALAPALERASGGALAVSYDPTQALKRRIAEGAAFDLVIATREALDELARAGTVVRESCRDIARSGLGLSVRKGAAKPDISTREAFTRALLDAKSVVRSAEGASGRYFATLIERLGIAQAMRGKIILGPSGRVAELLVRGEAEIAVQQTSELLPVAGADYVGPFPPELQLFTVFAAGIGSAAKAPEAAETLIAKLTAPATRPLLRAHGLEPVSGEGS